MLWGLDPFGVLDLFFFSRNNNGKQRKLCKDLSSHELYVWLLSGKAFIVEI